MVLSDIRNYEVSIWTLQDGFISVLKYATLENKGQIQEPELKIIDDGTQEFTFKIPMYIIQDGEKIQNPIWYNTTNGVLVASTRKIKVIVNKKDAVRNLSQQRATEDEEIFEFIITKVTQTHQDEVLTCEVTCEGLAFHELGKIGYKFSLSQQDFLNEYSIWANATDEQRQSQSLEQPHATIQYWNDKIFNHLKYWTYQINMNWDGYLNRDNNKVYEDSYVSAWNKQNGLPKKVEMAVQKQRQINSSESNVYNLTQTIAETFGVFCKYVYQHDNNYNIIGRKVVYYNNFLNQKQGTLDFTYPYSTSSISREMDSTSLITKMYVKPVTSDTSRDGFINILTTSANRSGQDYVLNFDYMKDIGSITQEQYQEISNFEIRIARVNDELESLEEEIIKLQQAKVNIEANLSTYDRGRKLAEERYTEANDLIKSLTNNTGVLHVTGQRPANAVLLQDTNSNSYYLNITQTGIIPETLHIYRKYSYSAVEKDRVSNQIFGTFQFNEFNDIVKVVDIFLDNSSHDSSVSRSVYLTYDYDPLEYAQRVKEIWARKMAADQAQYKKADSKIKKINSGLEIKNNKHQQLLAKKRKYIQDFQTMMGPALRQGYWMPDQYKDYGDKLEATFSNGLAFGTVAVDNDVGILQDAYGNYYFNYSQNYTDQNGYATPIWDTISLENQQLPYYQQGINQDKKFYHCIKLTQQQLNYIQNNENVSFIFYDLSMNQTLKNYRSFSIGSQCQLGLLKDENGKVFPILILIGAKDMTDEQIQNMKASGNNDIICSTTTTTEKRITYPISESVVELSNEISRKLTQQLIVTTNIQDEKIQEKTITKQYEIKKFKEQTQNQTDVPVPVEEKAQPLETLNAATKITEPANSKFPITLRSSMMSLTTELNFTSSDEGKYLMLKNDISVDVLVSTRNNPWAYVNILLMIDSVAVKQIETRLHQGTNTLHFQNIDVGSSIKGGAIKIKIISKDPSYWLPIESIKAKMVPRQENNISVQYSITKKINIERPPEQTLTKVVIWEKNLFHPDGFEVTLQGENFNTISSSDGQLSSDLIYFYFPYDGNNSYTVFQYYGIDKVNFDIFLTSRVIKHGSTTLYSEIKNGDNYEITDNLSSSIEKYSKKIIKLNTEEQNQQGEKVKIRIFEIETNKYSYISTVDTCACLGKINYNISGQTVQVQLERGVDIDHEWERQISIDPVTHKISKPTYVRRNSVNWLALSENNYGYIETSNNVTQKNYISVFPRIQINSLKLKEDSLQLSVLYNKESLSKYKNYSLTSRNDKYYISFKIQKFLQINMPSASGKIGLQSGTLRVPQMKLYYCLSNADTAIYLDAIQVLKQNAYPKVSYQIEINMINPDFIRTIYNKMGYIAHINDNQLKFENVLGYISEITMHLDKPWEDQIVIKNYKTDFENLFSTIVASTQAMKKNAYTIGLAAGAFDSNGNLSLDAISQALAERGIIYNFNNGRLTINQKDGILGISQSGVVNFRCNGIFTSAKKDEDGQWIWNTAITPNGINADLITTGQLDTNRIKIFSGDNLRFQFNENGLFGYKSFLENFKGSHALQRLKSLRNYWEGLSNRPYNTFEDYFDSLNNSGGYTNLQYIKFNENGLFLVAENGATIYSNEKYSVLNKDVTRIQISWSGLKLRNWNNQQVFWADPDSGNLYITGTVFADSFKILKHKADLNDSNAIPMGLLEFLSVNFEDHVRVSQNLQYIFNAAGDILRRSLSSLSTLNGSVVENAGILQGFLSRAKQIPHSPIQLIAGDGDRAISAISIHPTQGIWMGSTNSLTFYSGEARRLQRNNKTGQYIELIRGASVLIDKDKILFGVANIKGVPEDIPLEFEDEEGESSDDGEGSGSTIPDSGGDDQQDLSTPSEGEEQEENPVITQTGAVEITADQIVLAVGQTIGDFEFQEDQQTQVVTTTYTPRITYDILKAIEVADPETGQIVSNEVSGVVITKDSIGLATATLTVDNTVQRDLILMDQNGIIIGVAEDANAHIDDTPIDNDINIDDSENDENNGSDNNSDDSNIDNSNDDDDDNNDENSSDNTPKGVKSGSFVKISKLGIIIGSDANLYINTKNTLLQTSKTLLSHENPVTIFGLGYNISDWNNLNYQDIDIDVQEAITTTLDSSGKVISETFNSVTTSHVNVNGNSNWGLFFDGENLHIKGFLYAKNIRIMLQNGEGGNGYYFPDYLHYEFQTRAKVSHTLQQIFTTVGSVLSQSKGSMDALNDAIESGYTVLEGLREAVGENLTPVQVKGPYHESHFKAGDIWIKTAISTNSNDEIISNLQDVIDDENTVIRKVQVENNPYESATPIATYVAMVGWGDCYDTNNDAINGISQERGWTRTYDYSLAAIKGAAFNIDAVDGTIQLLASKRIDLKSGGTIYLAANDSVNIVGNEEVNIGGATINIASYRGHLGGIHLVNSSYTSQSSAATSKVDIDANGIVLASKNGIQIKSGSGIDIKSSTDEGVSAISLDNEKGIWLGSNKGITLFSGNIVLDYDSEKIYHQQDKVKYNNIVYKYVSPAPFAGKTPGSDTSFWRQQSGSYSSAAAVQITNQKILFGLSDLSYSGTVVEMRKDYIILAASGIQAYGLRDNSQISYNSNISGMKITKDGFWLATGDSSSIQNPRALVAITPGNIRIGTSSNSSGNYVEITQTGITIGGTGNLIINTNNIAIDTIGHPENNNSYNTYFRLGPVSSPGLMFDGTNLFIRGSIYANAFYVIGEDNNPVLFDNYLQASIGDIDISSTLEDIFNEAGNVLQAATTSISVLRSYLAENDSIYESLKTKLMNGLVSDQRKIELFGSNGIQLYTGSLNISNGTINNLSAIKIDQTNGIWLGSSVGITLYATPGANDTTYSHANVSITNSQILFGVSSTGDATVAQFKKDYIILCAANQRNNIELASTTAEWQSASQTGVKITKDGFWIASGSSSLNNRALVAITPGNITLGTVSSNYEGSFVEIAQTGITIGSTSNLYINTNNFGLNTDADNSHNSYFRLGPSDGPSLVYSGGNLVVAGTIRANNLYIGDSNTAINNISQLGGGNEFYQTSSNVPTTYKKNDWWLQTGTGKLFVAIRDVGTSPTTQDWDLINNRMQGTCFKVDTGLGTITAFANKSITFCQSNGQGGAGDNDTITNVLSLNSSGIDIYSGQSVKIGVATSNGVTTNTITLSSAGISLTGGRITLSSSSAISMTSAGTFRIKAKSGYLEFQNSSGDIAFKVDTEGNVYCKSINAENITYNEDTTTSDSSSEATFKKTTMTTISYPSGTATLSGSVTIVANKKYKFVLTLTKDSSTSGYLQNCGFTVGRKTFYSTIPIPQSQTTTIRTFECQGSTIGATTINSITMNFKFDPQQTGGVLDFEQISIKIYSN